jgi:cobalt-precorrin-5B (C1)-methyltransferase
MPKKNKTRKILRSGYTTGACAAAAAKAATMSALAGLDALNKKDGSRGDAEARRRIKPPFSAPPRLRVNLFCLSSVEIPFPDGSRHTFTIRDITSDGHSFCASVVKDAGDDPDVTHGAVITAEVAISNTPEASSGNRIIIRGGPGVGTVTKPGLPVPVGEAAINPVPKKMIEAAVLEALDLPVRQTDNRDNAVRNSAVQSAPGLVIDIAIGVIDGERLAQKTLNPRLGILGGLSILGTTGIVTPLSSEAWTASIKTSMCVAKACGLDEIVLSTGRTSERAHMSRFALPEASYVMMGDHAGYALTKCRDYGFRRVVLCAQWAKLVKIAMGVPQTHVRHGALDADAALEFLNALCPRALPSTIKFNTAREIFGFIQTMEEGRDALLSAVMAEAARKAGRFTGGTPVSIALVSYDGKVTLCDEPTRRNTEEPG